MITGKLVRAILPPIIVHRVYTKRKARVLLSPVLFFYHDIMSRSIPTSFYKSTAWRKTRAAFLLEHPYCERCMAAGILRPAEHVHHKTHLTMANYKDPSVSLAWDNLEALCQDCHNREHFAQSDLPDDLHFDADGNVSRG